MPDFSIQSIISGKPNDVSLEEFHALINYLKVHIHDIPFNFSTIAHDLHWPEARIHSFFLIIRDLYQLFRLQENEIATRMTAVYEPKLDPHVPKQISMAIAELQSLVDCHFLTARAPQSMLTLQEIPRFHHLILDYGMLFAQEAEGWVLSEEGEQIAIQFHRYQRLHMVPDQLIGDGFVVQVIEESD